MIKSVEQLNQILQACDFGKPYELPETGYIDLTPGWFRNRLPSCRSHRWKIRMKKLKRQPVVPHWTSLL